MKKIAFIIAITTLSFAAKAQTIDTAFHRATAVKIHPVTARFYDTIQVTHLGVISSNDNLKNRCTFQWTVYDDRGRSYLSGNMIMSGIDYASWQGDNITPFRFVATKLKLTFQ